MRVSKRAAVILAAIVVVYVVLPLESRLEPRNAPWLMALRRPYGQGGSLVVPTSWSRLRSIPGDWILARSEARGWSGSTWTHFLNLQPPRAQPERERDRTRYPRSAFWLSFSDATGFAIDTKAGTVTQDRILDPDTTIAMRLSDAQIDTLYEDALRCRLLEMPQPAQLQAFACGGEKWSGVLNVQAGAARNSLRWLPWSRVDQWSDDHKRLDAYIEELQRMVHNAPGFRALPRPRGNYID